MPLRLSSMLGIALVVRIANALLSRTFFQPDEYWQSLEVAHRLVFGYGHQTWEWRVVDGVGGIRSPLYPLLFVPVFWALKVTGLDQTALLTLGPRLVQAGLAAAADVATAQLAVRLFGPSVANTALLCSLTSFFNFHALTRTFSNSTETTLTAMALALWPWEPYNAGDTAEGRVRSGKREFSSLGGALVLAASASILRPSNIVIWVLLGLYLLTQTSGASKRLQICSTAVGVGLIAAGICFAIDSIFYGTPTFTPYNFFLTNVLNSISIFYGANTAHFYLSQALPFTTMFMLPFVLLGLLRAPRTPKIALAQGVLAGTVGLYSLLAHKEFRFIHPLLPILHSFAAYYLHSRPHLRPILFLSFLPAVYLTAFHCVGQVTILDSLRRIPVDELKSVGFLMPCHSTPWMSHLHLEHLVRDTNGESGVGGRAWYITCEPPILGQNASTYRDQSDFFYASPPAYLSTRFPADVNASFPPSPFPPFASSASADPNDLDWRHEWPSHIVLFDALLRNDPEVSFLLDEKGYVERERVWNSHWHEDERRAGDLVILSWKRPIV